MSLNERLKDLDNQSSDGWFEIIKDVCWFQAKQAVCRLSVILLLFIVAGIYFMTSRYPGGEIVDIAAICFSFIICFVLVCGIVNNVGFLLKAVPDTPEQITIDQHFTNINHIHFYKSLKLIRT